MDCCICLEEVLNPRKTQCGHIYCYDCIYNWINEKNYYGEKNKSCPLCRRNIGILSRVNVKKEKKIKKKAPVKRFYKTRYKIAEEKIRSILGEYSNIEFHFESVDELWNMAERVFVEGRIYLTHNKSMREVFNRKMKEFSLYDEKFLTLIKT